MTTGVGTVGAKVATYRDAQARPVRPPSTPQMNRLLERKTTATRASAPEETASTTATLLNRRASRAQEAGDDPFPYVASLPPRPKPKSDKPAAEAKPRKATPTACWMRSGGQRKKKIKPGQASENVV